jgi:uncharacterized hydantoinase/oxoprolinase family protein
MATYAVMSGNTVTNIIVADNKEEAAMVMGAELIEYTDDNPAGIDWTYDQETGKFNPPEIFDESVNSTDIEYTTDTNLPL